LRTGSEPIFNVPAVVTATLAVIVLVHALRAWVLTSEQDIELLLLFSFIPARYDATVLAQGAVPGGVGAQIWTFVTYALIHGDWTHLGLNGVWLLAFGTPVARRFGAVRYLLFFAVTAAAGAAVHLAFHAHAFVPMVGASASISGFMAAAMRFAFQRSGPLGLIGRNDLDAYRVPALPLTAVLRDGRVLAFLGVWFALNLLFGIGSLSLDGSEQAIAWQAHIGGFLAGLLAFALFDPVKAAPPGGSASEPDQQATFH
jgi:membrane associated rhomboid family serine protease